MYVINDRASPNPRATRHAVKALVAASVTQRFTKHLLQAAIVQLCKRHRRALKQMYASILIRPRNFATNCSVFITITEIP